MAHQGPTRRHCTRRYAMVLCVRRRSPYSIRASSMQAPRHDMPSDLRIRERPAALLSMTVRTSPGDCTAVDQDGGTNPFYADEFSPSPLTTVAPSPTITYGNPVPLLSPTYSGFVRGDGISSLTKPATSTASVPSAIPPADSYPVTCSEAVDPDYDMNCVGVTLTLDPAPLPCRPPTRPSWQVARCQTSLPPTPASSTATPLVPWRPLPVAQAAKRAQRRRPQRATPLRPSRDQPETRTGAQHFIGRPSSSEV